jgi:hypothetical protein
MSNVKSFAQWKCRKNTGQCPMKEKKHRRSIRVCSEAVGQGYDITHTFGEWDEESVRVREARHPDPAADRAAAAHDEQNEPKEQNLLVHLPLKLGALRPRACGD